MKLYYAPGACSLADHIALREADLDFEIERVDLKAKRTETGADYTTINPKGYVPALLTDEGATITENIAILDWIAGSAPALVPRVRLARTRLLETLAFISTELHKSFKPFFAPDARDEDKAKAADQIGKRLALLAGHMEGDYLFGDDVTVADAYLFVMLLWARKNAIGLPDPLPSYFDRMRGRPAVAAALSAEGIG